MSTLGTSRQPARSAQVGLKALLLAGAAGAALFAAYPAAAQSLFTPAPTHPARQVDDGLGPRDVYLEADTLIDDHATNTVTAIGHVEARYQGRVLRADRVDYNTVTGVSHARGHAVIVNPDGTTEYGQDIQLDDQFRAAVATGFAARLQQNVTITAGAAIRRNDVVNQLNSAIYTACNICAGNKPKTPTWSIQASRIIEDREHQVIYYRNAVIRVLGVPVFYSPIFWHPDPTAPRRSGFLPPRVSYTKKRGFTYEQPYYWVISPSTDLTISPQINTRVNPFLNLDYRERFYSGMIDLRGGYTYERNFNNQMKFGSQTSRSYILGQGLFELTPNWIWGFGAERVTDPTLFRRYNIPRVFEDRGPYPTDTDRLISQIYTVRQDATSYVSVAAMSFQSLRAYGVTPTGQVIAESNRPFPIVAPYIEARYDPADPILGGRLRARANIAVLNRNSTVVAVDDPTGIVPPGPQLFSGPSQLAGFAALPQGKQLSALTYTDSRQGDAQVDWRATYIFGDGMRVDPFLLGRADLFSTANAALYLGGLPAHAESTATRLFGTVGADFSWPFIRQTKNLSVVLEPLAQIALSPVIKPNPNIPNEDSVAFEFDETNLFSQNRFSGFDLLESGQRLNVGGRATFNWGAGQNAIFTVGRTFRAQPDLAFTAQTGLRGTASDWVTALTVNPWPGFLFFNRTRLDADTFAVRREEAGANFGFPRLNWFVRYLYDQSGYTQTPSGQTIIGRVEDLTFGGTAFVTKHWGLSANVTRDLQLKTWPVAQIGLVYQDECIRVDVLYTHDETFSNVIGTSNSITLRLTLATLGGTSSPGYRGPTGR